MLIHKQMQLLELELVLIKESHGTRFIGDNISPFQAGELVLIGENLPHMWQNHDSYFEDDSEKMATAIGIHFKKDFLGSHFFDIPEMKHISRLFEKARLGISFKNPDDAIIKKIEDDKKAEQARILAEQQRLKQEQERMKREDYRRKKKAGEIVEEPKKEAKQARTRGFDSFS